MPEMPEVEVVRRELVKTSLHKKIVRTSVRFPKIVKNDATFEQKIVSKEFIDVSRRGKLLFFHLDDGNFLLGHLKMTGQFIFVDKDGKLAGGGHSLTELDMNLPHKHTHITFFFDDGSKLYFNDMRRFGYVYWGNEADKIGAEAKFGIEPGLGNWTWKNFAPIFDKRKTTVKALLLNQKVVSGLGNIYVDEALYHAGVRPERVANTMTVAERKLLFHWSSKVMMDSIAVGGTTFYDFTNVSGQPGNYTNLLQVFTRQGKPCFNCGTTIKKIKCAGRGTHFCPNCQK